MENNWSWVRMLSRLEEDTERKLFRSVVEKNSFDIRVVVYHFNNYVELSYSITPNGSGLTRHDVKEGTSSVISWAQFFEELTLLPDYETAGLEVYRNLRVGEDRLIHLGPVFDAYAALMPIYELGYGYKQNSKKLGI